MPDIYANNRLIKTGYSLTQSEIDKLSQKEKEARKKTMIESREELKRLEEEEIEDSRFQEEVIYPDFDRLDL